MKQSVTTTYMEMCSVRDFRPVTGYREKVYVKKVLNNGYLGLMLFAGVGLPWQWYSRIAWSPDDWDRHYAGTDTHTWLVFSGNALVGYFELEYQQKGNTEIKFLGLLPQYVGKGLGGSLLSVAIDKAWSENTGRVWVHTCDLDAPAAVENYKKRGFREYDRETQIEEVPDRGEFTEKMAAYFDAYIQRYQPGED